jgi:poly-gamma-glutamate synthesis protein (capsule biosynthesis protein)
MIVAHAAIDAGATAIIGHHPHQLQGIELYKGGIIFYSLGNFSFWRDAARKKARSYCSPEAEYTQDDAYSIEPDPGFVFNYKRHFNEGGIAFIDVDRLGLARVEFLPTVMDEAGQPNLVRSDQPQFAKSLDYLNWAGKFIAGGLTQLKAVDGRYEVFARSSA